MTVGSVTLDDRLFQDLVSDARRRIGERCPEWTEHNVSDPGITLIETFASMTEMLVYRLNQVPENVHRALLDLLDIELGPPAAAKAELRFRLTAPVEQPLRLEARETEVATVVAAGEEPLVFHVRDDFVIPPAHMTAFVLQRSTAFESITVSEGTARPLGREQPAFSTPPAIGDAIHLGFDGPLSRLVMRVEVEGSRAQGVGVDPKAPPLRWEVSHGTEWVAAEVLEDTTGGFNEAGGTIELQIPARTTATTVNGHHAHWLRCQVTELTTKELPSPRYSHPPRIHSITAHPIGALVAAEHAATEHEEVLGESDGTSGQVFPLRHPPAMDLREDEALQVLEPGKKEWIQWQRRESFDTGDEPWYRFDAARGQIELGPAIRQRDGSWQQHGAVPPKGARLRMTRYRHGGGGRGNVARNTLRQLRQPIAGIASVTNPEPARGGVDAETVEAAQRRAALELRTRYRAVTVEDFEFLVRKDCPQVARVLCLDPSPGEAIPVWILPNVADPARRLKLAELRPDEELLAEVADHLDGHRIVGTSVHVMPVLLRGVTIVADLEVARGAHSDAVEHEVTRELYRFINPLVGGNTEGPGEGWDFGRALNEAELHALVHELPGVKRVRMLRMYATELRTPDAPAAQPTPTRLTLAPNELLCSAIHRVRARHFR